MFNIFLFAANNTTVEWALHRGLDNSYTIGTLHKGDNAGNWEDYGIPKPIASVHSHPGIAAEHITELESMGYWYNGTYTAGDWKML